MYTTTRQAQSLNKSGIRRLPLLTLLINLLTLMSFGEKGGSFFFYENNFYNTSLDLAQNFRTI